MKHFKVVTIVGARPQFIKAAPVSRVLRKAGHTEVLVHTGQHYDESMSAIFFLELEIPEPDVNLEIGSGPHGLQTAQMIMSIEKVLLAEKPDWVLIYGDTNSTLAGALAAVKLHIPVAHVEAGLRSFNRQMPEEYNRVIADHCSDLLFCPTQTAVGNLTKEGITQGVHLVGDVMYDSLLYSIQLAEKRSYILEKLKLKPKSYALATVHRAENTDDNDRLISIFQAFERIGQNGLTIIVPLHPRTKKSIKDLNLKTQKSKINVIDPVGYLDMLLLEKNASIILTDSGGIQKEAYWFKVPCITLRDETEWVETLESGWNVLAGCDPERIIRSVKEKNSRQQFQDACGKGQAAELIVHIFSSA